MRIAGVFLLLVAAAAALEASEAPAAGCAGQILSRDGNERWCAFLKLATASPATAREAVAAALKEFEATDPLERVKAEYATMKRPLSEENLEAVKEWIADVRKLSGALLAEYAARNKWRGELCAPLQAALWKSVSLDGMKETPLAAALGDISRQIGATIELSPAAAVIHQATTVTFEGQTEARTVLDKILQDLKLAAGELGGKIVLVPAAPE